SRPTSPPGAASSSTPRTISTSRRTGRYSRAPRFSSPCCPSTTSGTASGTPSIHERSCRPRGPAAFPCLLDRSHPVTARDLCYTPAADLVRLYKSRACSPVEAMQAVLARLDGVNPAVTAGATVARESALAEAKRAPAGLKRGRALPPLFGVPVSIKDLTLTKGIRTTWGSKVHEHDVPKEDSLVVERLKAAGAIVFAKTNTPEFGAGGNTFNAVFGATRNPWDPALTCGGSSGGAAVALAT